MRALFVSKSITMQPKFWLITAIIITLSFGIKKGYDAFHKAHEITETIQQTYEIVSTVKEKLNEKIKVETKTEAREVHGNNDENYPHR